jgi:menaquinol-cytochrome c reductase iron-sulfur subunit
VLAHSRIELDVGRPLVVPEEVTFQMTSSNTNGGVEPVALALGVAVALVGLVIDPLVVTPIGAAVAVGAGVAWMRRDRATESAEPPPARLLPDEDRFTRERLLGRATVALGGLIGLAVSLPVAGFAIIPSFVAGRKRAVDLGPISGFPVGKFVVVTFLADPKEGEISRRAAYIRNNGLLGTLPSFTILSSRCTHVGCPTQPNGPLARGRTERTGDGEVGLVPVVSVAGFGCPCHGSQFDTEGTRTAGPAPRPLDRYEFSVRNGRLYLGRLYSVSRIDGTGAQARIHAYPLQGAGQPLSGVESWLYPVEPAS